MTTDEMDSTDREERYKLVAMCDSCGEWTHFTGKPEHMIQSTHATCHHCGHHGLMPNTIMSERTFNETKAKAETAKWRRKQKK